MIRPTRRNFMAAAAAAPAVQLAPGKLRAGAAAADITPPLGCSLAGNMSDGTGREVHDPLHVRAIALESGSQRLAVAQVDSCVIPREIFDKAKQLIEANCSIPPDHVLLSATHTHTAPPSAHLFQSRPDPAYTAWLTVRIADAVRMAVNRLEPARAGWGVGREERLVFNRRYFMKPGTIPPNPFGAIDGVQMNPPAGSPNIVKAAGPTDPEVGVLALMSAAGRPIAVLGNYALHYVGGTGSGHISGDYFAAWCTAMTRLAGATDARAYPPFVASLANGCSGNINAINFLRPRAKLPPYVQMEQYADVLAAECYRTWRRLEYQDDLELRAAAEEVELGVRLPGPEDVAAARKLIAGAPEPYKDRPQIYARETLIMAESFPKVVKTPVQALRIGPMAIAAFPAEAFVELGMEVKAKSPFQPTFLIELANDYRGYVPTVEAHEQGGYETWRAKSSYLEKQAAPKLVAALTRCLQRVA